MKVKGGVFIIWITEIFGWEDGSEVMGHVVHVDEDGVLEIYLQELGHVNEDADDDNRQGVDNNSAAWTWSLVQKWPWKH